MTSTMKDVFMYYINKGKYAHVLHQQKKICTCITSTMKDVFMSDISKDMYEISKGSAALSEAKS